jgi:soluble cytochrome b562
LNEEIIFVGSAIAGSLLTIAIDRLVRPALSKTNDNTLTSNDSVRTELNSLEFERNLVAESAIKVDEAFNEKRIDIYERDKLLQRYTAQIEQFDERIDKFQNLIDFSDLRNQRDSLTELMNKRISSIDQRLGEIHNRFVVTYGNSEGDRIEQLLENAVQEAVHNNLHDSKRSDELRMSPSSSSSPHDLSRPRVDDSPEVKQLEELHHQIVLELDRLENDEKKVDETHAAESKDVIQGSTALNQFENDLELIPGNNRETTKERKQTTPSSFGKDEADEG